MDPLDDPVTNSYDLTELTTVTMIPESVPFEEESLMTTTLVPLDSFHGNLSSTNHQVGFCGPEFQKIVKKFLPDVAVLQVGLLIVLFGILTNILNLLVFSRPKMKNSTNTILFCIALFDLIPMLIFPAYYVYKMDQIVGHGAVSEYFGLLSHVLLSFSLGSMHTSSILATTTLAIWRYTAVLHPLKARSICTMKKAIYIMTGICILNLVVTIAVFGNTQLARKSDLMIGGGILNNGAFFCGPTLCLKTPYPLIRKLQVMYNGLICRFIPGAILTFVSVRLIGALRDSHQRRKQMTNASSTAGGSVSSCGSQISFTSTVSMTTSLNEKVDGSNESVPADDAAGQKNDATVVSSTAHNTNGEHGNPPSSSSPPRRPHGNPNKNDDSHRITKMLLAVLLLFLATELPPAVQTVLAIFSGKKFSVECWRIFLLPKLVMYFLSGAFNFVIFVRMSTNYRKTLQSLFLTQQAKKIW